MALLSPWSYFGREATGVNDMSIWVMGPNPADQHGRACGFWPALWPDRGPLHTDLWRAHTRNIGGA